MKKQQSTLGKAFKINRSPSIYGTFAEIGAGQEIANHFFRAGLASQTIAKSMSAYDMIFSDEIYGKQNRYVCKDRVINMLNHEYKLLQRRLKNKSSEKCFFAFANTAATSSIKKNEKFEFHYSWMGIRFQAKPQSPYNEIIFHVDCLDQNRLQQHEALGILGVNLIHSCFYYRSNYKKFITALMDNLHNSRVQISSISCKGPDLNHFNETLLNIELLTQQLSPLTLFNPKGGVAFISDIIFKKNLLLIHKEKGIKREFSKEAEKNQKSNVPILLVSAKDLGKKDTDKEIKSLANKKFFILIPYADNLSKVKQLLRKYTDKNITIIISKKLFLKDIFSAGYYKTNSVLRSIGLIFDSNTTVKVSSDSDKSFSVKTSLAKLKEKKIVDYLIKDKKILDL